MVNCFLVNEHTGDINFMFWGDLYPFLVVVMEPKGTELKVDHNDWITSFTESLLHQSEGLRSLVKSITLLFPIHSHIHLRYLGCVALVKNSDTSGLVCYSSPAHTLPLHIGKYMFIAAETAERWY